MIDAPPATPQTRLKPPAPRVTVRNDDLRPHQQRIALLTILGPTIGLVAAVGVAVVRGFTALDFWMLVTGVVLGQLFLEVGYHRLLAHRSFETPHWMRLLLAIGGSMTAQGRPTHWVANHRRHHLHSDTPEDPHSPWVRAKREGGSEELGMAKGLLHAHWGHMLTDDVPNCTLFARDMNQGRGMRWVNDHYGWIVTAGLVLPALVGLALTGTVWGALSGFLWGGLARMFVVQNVTWAVASVSHRFGYTSFETGDHSKNLLWTAIPPFGSGYQNNHHAFPHAAMLGMRWWELDVAGWAIHALRPFGLAKNLKRPSDFELEKKRLRKARSEPSLES